MFKVKYKKNDGEISLKCKLIVLPFRCKCKVDIILTCVANMLRVLIPVYLSNMLRVLIPVYLSNCYIDIVIE